MPQAMTGLTGWLGKMSINKRLTVQSVSTGAFGLLLIATIVVGSYFSMQMIEEGDRNANAALQSALLEKDFASLERDAFRHALIQDGDTEEGYRGNVTDLGTSIDDTRGATNVDQSGNLQLVEDLAADYVTVVDSVIAAGRTGKAGVNEIMDAGDKVDAAIETVRDQTIALSAATTVEKQSLETLVMGSTIVIALLIAVVSYLMSRALKKLIGGELEDLRVAIAEIEAGHLQLNVPHTERSDEVGELARAADRLRQARLAADEKDKATTSMIENVSDRLTALAEGDLTVQLKDVDPAFSELRDSFNRSVSRLRETMNSVASSADSVRSGSMEISQASEDLAQRTESQAVDLTRMTEKMTEMSNGMAETAEAASKAASGVDAAVAEARHGGEVVSRAIKAMSTIEGSTHEIGKIISVIDGISFQTNLLALNAGVEAARAGEVGRGFAVVASEVRELAQRSSNAAEEIRQLIGASTEQVASGVTLVRETGEALDKIIEKIAEVTQIATQISSATGSQSHNLKDANKVMTGIDHMTQQNAAMGEESNAAARRLAEEADNLTRMVQSFRFSDGAKAIMSSAPAAATPIAAEPVAKAASASTSAPVSKPVSAPRVAGNLALAEEPADFADDDEDWAEF